jgi:hypothetical protein
MTPNTTILPRNQKPNTTATTREKGRRLTVLDSTAREAVVEGDTSDYTVIFRGLSCSCDAGRAGLHCSHVQSALIERAHMTGYENVMFAHNQDHADAFAAMQRATGKRAISVCEFGWYYVTYGKQSKTAVAPVAPRPVRPMVDAQAAADSLFL